MYKGRIAIKLKKLKNKVKKGFSKQSIRATLMKLRQQ